MFIFYKYNIVLINNKLNIIFIILLKKFKKYIKVKKIKNKLIKL